MKRRVRRVTLCLGAQRQRRTRNLKEGLSLPPCPHRCLVALVLPMLAVSLVASSAQAVPLQVRARTTVSLALERGPGGATLVGKLVDDRGDPIASESVSVHIDGVVSRSVVSAADGSFRLALDNDVIERATAMHGASIPFRAGFDGDRRFGRAQHRGVVDVAKRPSTMTMKVAPQRMPLFAGKVRVAIELQSGSTALANRPVSVRVGDGRELVVTTDSYGSAAFLVHDGVFGSAGRYTVEARFLGDALHGPAIASSHFTVTQPTRITLRVGREGSEREGRYRFSGRLSDLEGPVSGATVAVLVRSADGEEERVLRLARTDDRGVFLAAIPGQELFGEHRGDLMMRAVYSPTDDVTGGAISRPVSVRGRGAAGVPVSYYLIALAWLVALAGVVQLVRRGVLAQWWAGLRGRWSPKKAKPPVESEAALPFITPPAAKPGPKARPNAVSGVVVDGHSRSPLEGVAITLTSATELLTVRTDADGRLEVAELAPGVWQLTMSLKGYTSRSTEVSVPHGGQLDGARFALVAIRRAVRDIYSDALESFEGALEWGRTTPREAFELAQVPTNERGRALGELRHVVEQAWYGGETPEPADELRARQLAAKVRSEVTR